MANLGGRSTRPHLEYTKTQIAMQAIEEFS